jgi:CheY-like chemotaxis protein
MKKKLNCVLLVDDSASDNFIHKLVIEQTGITEHIEIAWNGREALDFLTTKGNCGKPESLYCQPELIFLDINMPVMDGWEFLEEYKKLDSFQKGEIVIIMLTSSLIPYDRIKAEGILKGCRFQNKPLTKEMIYEIIQDHFPDYC